MELQGDVGHVESRFDLFGDGVSISARKVHGLRQTNHGLGIILEHPMALVGDEAQVEAHFALFGDSANLNTRQVNGLCQTYHWLRNLFERTRWNS
jgi:hypothetical protein